MNSRYHLLIGASVVSLALSGPLTTFAAPKESPSPEASAAPAKEKPPRAIPFRGTVTEVDQSAKTFTIAGKESSRVFKVTEKTIVTKAGSPATMGDLTDNETVTGSYWKGEDGMLEAKSLKIGGKAAGDKAASGKEAKSKDKDAAEASSPSPSSSPRR